MVYGLFDPESTGDCTDEQLLSQFVTQSDEMAQAAFAILVERYSPIVHHVCWNVLGNAHDAQDAAQAVFLVLARQARSIRKPHSLGPWLHGVAVRVARRAKTAAGRRRVAEQRKAEMVHEIDGIEWATDPTEFCELHEEIDRLPEKYRVPIILCYMQGQSQTQVARTLGWPLGTVQTRLHRGRERLRSQLAHRGASMVDLPSKDLRASLVWTPVLFEREWTETTAHAAVRFAAGKGTAGLVSSPVSGLAETVLAAMLGDSLMFGGALRRCCRAGTGCHRPDYRMDKQTAPCGFSPCTQTGARFYLETGAGGATSECHGFGSDDYEERSDCSICRQA